ncbi:retention module-containing protein, partial [Aromatoleum toluclasticum]|uniref:retention module-containing protein n=1 Tax=Aromatoleum toluclasticum TaxID=92003 RepID=UPI000360F6D0
MAQAIAVVVAVTGRAFARDVKGNLRPLKAGDTLQEGEVVITMSGGHVELAMSDGAPMVVSADQVVTLTSEVSATTRPGREDAQVSQGTVDQVIQALEQGGNLDDLEAPAAGLAGGGGGGEGNNFVRLLRITEGVGPLEFRFAQEPSAQLQPEEPAPITQEAQLPGATVTLGDISVFEGTGTATITATISSPVTGSDLVITLSNGAIIVIPVGSTTGTSTPFPIQGDDPYIDAETFPVSVVDTTGSGFSTVTPTGPATVEVRDTIDPTNSSLNVTLEAAPSLTEDGATLTYVVTLNAAVRPGDDPVTITFTDLAGNTQTITISEGTSGSLAVPIPESLFEDVYKEADAVLPVATNVTLAGGSNFEALNPPTVGNVTLVDTIDTTTVTLNASSEVSELGGTITYTASVASAPLGTPLELTLSNGAVIVIPVGSLTGSTAVTLTEAQLAAITGDNVTVTITSATGGTYEALNTSDDAITRIDRIINVDGDTITVNEAGLVGEGGTVTPVTASGSFVITAPDGVGSLTIQNLTIGDMQVIVNGVFTPTSATTPLGNTLSVTAFDPATGTITYSYTLNAAETHTQPANDTTLVEQFGVVATDGDPVDPNVASSQLTVTIVDDVPSVTVTATGEGSVTTDETTDLGSTITASAAVANISALTGADGGTTNVKLVVDVADSGLTTVDGKAITLVADTNDNTVLGRYDSDGNGSLDATAFTVTISDAGVLSVTQNVALHHPDDTNPDDPVTLAGKLSLSVTTTDGDGDQASDTLAIGNLVTFEDDGP